MQVDFSPSSSSTTASPSSPQTFWIKNSPGLEINWSPPLMREGLFSAGDSFVAGGGGIWLKWRSWRDWGLVPASGRIRPCNRVVCFLMPPRTLPSRLPREPGQNLEDHRRWKSTTEYERSCKRSSHTSPPNLCALIHMQSDQPLKMFFIETVVRLGPKLGFSLQLRLGSLFKLNIGLGLRLG